MIDIGKYPPPVAAEIARGVEAGGRFLFSEGDTVFFSMSGLLYIATVTEDIGPHRFIVRIETMERALKMAKEVEKN